MYKTLFSLMPVIKEDIAKTTGRSQRKKTAKNLVSTTAMQSLGQAEFEYICKSKNGGNDAERLKTSARIKLFKENIALFKANNA